jgi:hypothetical protein
MPDIALLEPRVLNGVIQRFPPRDDLLGLRIVGRQPWPDTYWEYDVETRRRHVARPNVPNSPAHIISQQGIGKIRGGFSYTREKKVFEPTTIRWLRLPGTENTRNAETAVLREVRELTERADRFHEYLCWRMLAAGSINLTALGQPGLAVDFQVQGSHMPTASTFWTSPAANLVTDLQDWKRIVSRDSDATLVRFIGNSVTTDSFYRHMQVQTMLSDDQKRGMVTEGKLPRFQQINFEEHDRGYVDDFTNPSAPTFVPYIPDGYFVGLATGGPPSFTFLDGLLADDEAPQGATGRFMKTWREPDPSNRQVLLETRGFPVLYQPDHLMIVRVF